MFQSLGSELQEDDDAVRAFVAVRWRHAQAGFDPWPNTQVQNKFLQDDSFTSFALLNGVRTEELPGVSEWSEVFINAVVERVSRRARAGRFCRASCVSTIA